MLRNVFGWFESAWELPSGGQVPLGCRVFPPARNLSPGSELPNWGHGSGHAFAAGTDRSTHRAHLPLSRRSERGLTKLSRARRTAARPVARRPGHRKGGGVDVGSLVDHTSPPESSFQTRAWATSGAPQPPRADVERADVPADYCRFSDSKALRTWVRSASSLSRTRTSTSVAWRVARTARPVRVSRTSTRCFDRL